MDIVKKKIFVTNPFYKSNNSIYKKISRIYIRKNGTIVAINDDGTILIKTGERTMYKVVIAEVELLFDTPKNMGIKTLLFI